MITFINRPTNVRVNRLSVSIRGLVYSENYTIMKSAVERVEYDDINNQVIVRFISGDNMKFDHVIVDPTLKLINSIIDNKTLFNYLDGLL